MFESRTSTTLDERKPDHQLRKRMTVTIEMKLDGTISPGNSKHNVTEEENQTEACDHRINWNLCPTLGTYEEMGKSKDPFVAKKTCLNFGIFGCSAETPDMMKFRQNTEPTYRNKRTRIRLAPEGHLDYFLYDNDDDNHYKEYVISSGRNRAATIDGNGK